MKFPRLRLLAYLGRVAYFKLMIHERLAAGRGESLSSIAARLNYPRQAAYRHARRARQLFGYGSTSGTI